MRFRELLEQAGLSHVPVMTTEGGPVYTDLWDGRYARVVPLLYQEMLEAELSYMNAHDWYYCLCPWLWANSSAGHGGWADCQIFHPGHPWANSDGFLPVVPWLIARPLSADGDGVTPPDEPPDEEEPPVPPDPDTPLAQPTIWNIPEWNEAHSSKTPGSTGIWCEPNC